jgi:hypothetical protein
MHARHLVRIPVPGLQSVLLDIHVYDVIVI